MGQIIVTLPGFALGAKIAGMYLKGPLRETVRQEILEGRELLTHALATIS